MGALMDASIAATLGLGFLLGVRHALDPDHIVAVAALVSQYRRLSVSCLLGVFWGLGHSTALLVAGATVIALKLTISPRVERGLEMGVALVLMLLGGHVLLRTFRGAIMHRHTHSHGDSTHSHFHFHAHDHPTGDHSHVSHVHLLDLGARPFLVGVLHGMAGTAAIMLLVASTLSSAMAGVAYIAIFGLGSTIGMLVLSGVIGLPFVMTSSRSARIQRVVQGTAGAASLLLGAFLVWRLAG
jgi:ABC-type nickel/cobalt efflux system permease component RcnA